MSFAIELRVIRLYTIIIKPNKVGGNDLKKIWIMTLCFMLVSGSMFVLVQAEEDVVVDINQTVVESNINLEDSEIGDIITIYENEETNTKVTLEVIEKIPNISLFGSGTSGWSGFIPTYDIALRARVEDLGHWFEFYAYSKDRKFYAADRLSYLTVNNWSVKSSSLKVTNNKKVTLSFTAQRSKGGSIGINYNGLGMNLTGNSTASFAGYLILEMSATGSLRTLWSI